MFWYTGCENICRISLGECDLAEGAKDGLVLMMERVVMGTWEEI